MYVCMSMYMYVYEEDTEEEDDILDEEVEKAVNQLKKNKSPGTDGIAGEMIQAGEERMTEEIHKLCRQAWREGKIPEEWTKTILVTIPKKGDLMECSNYRTIALLNHDQFPVLVSNKKI